MKASKAEEKNQVGDASNVIRQSSTQIFDDARISVASMSKEDDKDQNRCFKRMLKYFLCHFPRERYSWAFFNSLLQDNCFYGCRDIFYKDGLYLNMCCLFKYRFPPGLFEDFLYYIFNNHTLLSMFLCARGNPFKRNSRRIAFFGQNAFAFFSVVFLETLITDPTILLILNFLIIAPISVIINQVFYYALVCPCLVSCKSDTGTNRCIGFFSLIGKFIAMPLLLAMVTLLLVVAFRYFTSSQDIAEDNITKYAYSVHVVASVQDLLYCMRFFSTGRSFRELKICCYPVFSAGNWFKSKVDLRHLEEGKNYTRAGFSLCGLISFTSIVAIGTQDDALQDVSCLKALEDGLLDVYDNRNEGSGINENVVNPLQSTDRNHGHRDAAGESEGVELQAITEPSIVVDA
jgi:hypothetical protein